MSMEFEANLADDGDDIATPAHSAPFPHRSLAKILVDAALNRADMAGIASGKVVMVVICADDTAVEHICGVFSRMAPGRTRALAAKPEQSKSWSPYGFSVPETLTVGQGIVVVASQDAAVPQLVRSLANRHIAIGKPTTEQIAAVIRQCHRGRVSSALASLSLDDVSFDDLVAAIGRGGRASEAVRRLSKLVKEVPAPEPAPISGVPVLADAIEFGAAREWGLALARDVRDYKDGRITWDELDRGAVLVSPPGCGKTTAVQSIAEACGLPLVMRSVADFFTVGTGHLGDVIKQQRAMFAAAKAQAPSILFIDEIDSLPRLLEGTDDFWNPVVSDFYLQLDSAMADREGVVVIGATNRGERMPVALRRNGRLERLIEMGPLDAKGAERVLLHHLGGTVPEGDIGRIYELAAGSTAATVMGWARAAKRAARIAQRQVTATDIEIQIVGADDRRPTDVSRAAYHEAGHLVAALVHPNLEVSGASIARNESSGGRVDFDRRSTLPTFGDLEKDVVVLLAGRAAEKAFLGDTSVGAGGEGNSDLAIATGTLASLYMSFGYLPDYPLWRCEPNHAISMLAMDHGLRETVNQHLVRLSKDAEALVTERGELVRSFAGALLKHRRISRREIHEIAEASGLNLVA